MRKTTFRKVLSLFLSVLMIATTIVALPVMAEEGNEVVEVKATYDTYVASGKTTTGYSADTKLFVKSENNTDPQQVRRSYLLMDTSETAKTLDVSSIGHVKLSLYCNNAATTATEKANRKQYRLYAFTDYEWADQSAITWDSMPTSTTLELVQFVDASYDVKNTWMEIDVTEYVKKHWGEAITFELRNYGPKSNDNHLYFSSLETGDGNEPRLSICTADHTATGGLPVSVYAENDTKLNVYTCTCGGQWAYDQNGVLYRGENVYKVCEKYTLWTATDGSYRAYKTDVETLAEHVLDSKGLCSACKEYEYIKHSYVNAKDAPTLAKVDNGEAPVYDATNGWIDAPAGGVVNMYTGMATKSESNITPVPFEISFDFSYSDIFAGDAAKETYFPLLRYRGKAGGKNRTTSLLTIGKTEGEATPASDTFTKTIEVTADTFVQKNKADTNYNTGSDSGILYVKRDDTTGKNTRHTFIAFDGITESADALDSVVLRLCYNYVSANTADTKNQDYKLYAIDPSTWTESSLTWNNMPNFSAEGTFVTDVETINAEGKALYAKDQWIEIDVTDFVKKYVAENPGKAISFVLTDVGTDNANGHSKFYSREGGNGPQLVLTGAFASEEGGESQPSVTEEKVFLALGEDYAFADGEANAIFYLEKDAWYNIQVAVDPIARSYRVYVDGEFVGAVKSVSEDNIYSTGLDEDAKFMFGFNGGLIYRYNVGYKLDNITVTKTDSEHIHELAPTNELIKINYETESMTQSAFGYNTWSTISFGSHTGLRATKIVTDGTDSYGFFSRATDDFGCRISTTSYFNETDISPLADGKYEVKMEFAIPDADTNADGIPDATATKGTILRIMKYNANLSSNIVEYAVGGQYVAFGKPLYKADGATPLTAVRRFENDVPTDTSVLQVIIDENKGTYSIYVDNEPAYFTTSGVFTAVIDQKLTFNVPTALKSAEGYVEGETTYGDITKEMMITAGVKNNDLQSIRTFVNLLSFAVKEITVTEIPDDNVTLVGVQQRAADVTEGEAQEFDLRFVFGIDNLFTSNVLFVVEAYKDGALVGTQNVSVNAAYSAIVENGDRLNAWECVEGEYFVAFKIVGIEEVDASEYSFFIVPTMNGQVQNKYWVSCDGHGNNIQVEVESESAF